MPVIDADTHAIEIETTWDYMEGPERAYRPRSYTSSDAPPGSRLSEIWLIEGSGRSRRLADDATTRTPQANRELRDVEARLRHMDELGVDIHVIYPTTLLNMEMLGRAEAQAAMFRSYNRWMADIYAQGGGRLRWVVAPPVMKMDCALDELQFGKEHGACGVLFHGLLGNRTPVDPYFFPLYEEAQRLDLPICIHAGEGNMAMSQLFHSRSLILWRAKMPVITAFHALVLSDVPAQFPTLRWGFIEAAASWVPYLLTDLRARYQRMEGKELPADVLQRNRFFVACQTEEDLSYILSYTGEDNVVIGSDYGHADTSSQLEALSILKGRSEEVGPGAIRKILCDNPARLYALS